MSPIARVFIVINLVFSVAFVALAGKWLEEGESWKRQYGKEVAAHKVTTDKMNTDISEVKQDLTAKTNDYNVVFADLNTKKNELESLLRENKNLKETQAENTANLAKFTSHLGSLKGAIDKYREQNTSLLSKESSAVKAKDVAENTQLALEDQIAGLKRAVAKLEEKCLGHEDNIASLEDKNSVQTAQLQNAIKQGYKVGVITPDVAGMVMDCHKDLNLVTLSVGKDDGVSKGYVFDIHRDGKYKARVKVIDVDAKLCVARIVAVKATIKKGDKAQTNL